MMRKASLLVIGAIAGATASWLVASTDFRPGSTAIAASPDTYRQLNLFGDVFERVRADYVEEPNDAELVEAAIQGMLTSLDPHSSFLNAKSFQDMQVQTRGEFGGLGIEVTMEDGYVKVVTPIDDTPAANAGVLAGDLITHLDGEAVQGLTLSEAVERMRGPVNTPIDLRIRREGADGPVEIQVVRDIIQIRSVRSRVEGDDIGYIRVSSFNEQTFDGVKAAIESLENEIGRDTLTGFVIDLRNNPGGLLDQAIAVSDAFLDRGEIVSTRGRESHESQRYNARSGDLTPGREAMKLAYGEDVYNEGITGMDEGRPVGHLGHELLTRLYALLLGQRRGGQLRPRTPVLGQLTLRRVEHSVCADHHKRAGGDLLVLCMRLVRRTRLLHDLPQNDAYPPLPLLDVAADPLGLAIGQPKR